MRFSTLVVALVGSQIAAAAQSWAGSNLYYAAGLSAAEQDTLFTGLQSAGVKVLRVWLDGMFSIILMLRPSSFTQSLTSLRSRVSQKGHHNKRFQLIGT
jgi:hypothetical protein